MDTLQKRIRFALEASKKKPTDLAKYIGISESAISQWINGPTKTINSMHLLKVSSFLSVNPQWLASGEGTPSNNTKDDSSEYIATAEEQKWLRLIRKLNHDQRTALFLSLTATLDDEIAKTMTAEPLMIKK